MEVLIRKQFTWNDQERFARLSGDNNPMHMDPVAARRTSAGKPAVHGIHLLLWALDGLLNLLGPKPVARIKVSWSHFVHVGETAEIVVKSTGKSNLRAEVLVGSAPVALITAFASARAAEEAIQSPGDIEWSSPETPADLSLEQMQEQSGALALATRAETAAEAFPHLAAQVGGLAVSGLLTLSRLVGMVCPGLHSIFASLDVDVLAGGESAGILYRVTEADPRFRFVTQQVQGASLSGKVEAFVRVPPILQPEIAELAKAVTPGEFTGSTALVVGASRGLGEVVAKLLAAGGADLIITYSQGRADADRVAESIRAIGRKCEIAQYDARIAEGNPLGGLTLKPTHAYYFATGPITQSRSPVFDSVRFDEYCLFYVKGFAHLCRCLREISAGPIRLFYPSSVYVAADEQPSGLTEYAMAKAAGETFCAQLGRVAPGLGVVVRRLPRLRTDQTASFLDGEAPAAAGEVLLNAVRELHFGSADGA